MKNKGLSKLWGRRVGIIASAGIPIVFSGVGIYYFTTARLNAPITDNDQPAEVIPPEDLIEQNIFPQLNSHLFYPYIEIKKGKPIFTDNFIARVIQYVIKAQNTNRGKTYVSYHYVDETELLFYFYWINNNYYHKKTYTFTLNLNQTENASEFDGSVFRQELF